MCDPFTDPYIAELRAMHARVEQILSDAERIGTISSAPASPSRDALPIPSPGLAGAGDPLVEQPA